MHLIDPACQSLRPLGEYASRLPSGRSGKRLNRATLWRWALTGLRGGRRLRTVAMGAARMTCDAWVWEFLTQAGEAQTPLRARVAMDPNERALIARRLGSSHQHRA